MRALLVVNPRATTTSERSRDVLVRALRSAVDLTVRYTERRGHATKLARDAAETGVDLVVTLGGDGTVNEAVNGLLTAAPALGGLSGPLAYRLPALAVVPGGSTNVFARALGMPRDWVDGTSVILDGIRDGRHRIINLGRADDRTSPSRPASAGTPRRFAKWSRPASGGVPPRRLSTSAR